MRFLRAGRRSRPIGFTSLAVLAIAGTALAGIAFAGADRQKVGGFGFTTKKPGASSGVKTSVSFPGATPETAVATITTKLARGARLDTSVPDRCAATDEELVAQGAAACPPSSKVGDGEIQLTELGVGDLTLFNAEDETIFLTEFQNPPIRSVNREAARGRTQVIEIPEGVTLERVALEIDRIQIDGESYLQTPSRCPDSGKWINTGTFVYRDGVEDRERRSAPCRKPGR